MKCELISAAAIRVLRDQHNCSLPVELWHNGPAELDINTRSVFEVGALCTGWQPLTIIIILFQNMK